MSCQQEECNGSSYQKNSERNASVDDDGNFRLGINYWKGKEGCAKNWKRAVKYLEAAEKLGHVEAGFRLGEFFLEMKRNAEGFVHIQLAAEKGFAPAQWKLGELLAYGHGCPRNESESRRWFSEARRSGFDGDDDKMEEILKIGQELDIFDREHHVNVKEITLTERLNFMKTYKGVDHIATLIQILSPSSTWIPVMVERAKAGSFYAMSFFSDYQNVFIASEMFSLGLFSQSLALICSDHDLKFNSEPFVKIAETLLEKDPNDFQALRVLSRYKQCAVYESVGFAARLVELDPNVPECVVRLGILLAFSGKFDEALPHFKRALEMFPNKDWLIDAATAFSKTSVSKNRLPVIEQFKEFISKCPPDHPRVPEAYYSIAANYAMSRNFEKAFEFVNKAAEAENPSTRLPCFPPVAGCKANLLQYMAANIEFGGFIFTGPPEEEKQPASNKPTAKATVTTCGYCGLVEPAARCAACKMVRYCDASCQKADWKIHKSTCIRRP